MFNSKSIQIISFSLSLSLSFDSTVKPKCKSNAKDKKFRLIVEFCFTLSKSHCNGVVCCWDVTTTDITVELIFELTQRKHLSEMYKYFQENICRNVAEFVCCVWFSVLIFPMRMLIICTGLPDSFEFKRYEIQSESTRQNAQILTKGTLRELINKYKHFFHRNS